MLFSGGSKMIREANKRDTEHIFDCVHPVCLYILKHIFQHNHNIRYGTNTTTTEYKRSLSLSPSRTLVVYKCWHNSKKNREKVP